MCFKCVCLWVYYLGRFNFLVTKYGIIGTGKQKDLSTIFRLGFNLTKSVFILSARRYVWERRFIFIFSVKFLWFIFHSIEFWVLSKTVAMMITICSISATLARRSGAMEAIVSIAKSQEGKTCTT